MIKICKDYRRATCIVDLSHLKGKISSDLYEDDFPIIGSTYIVESIVLVNEKRDSLGRCIPRRGIELFEDNIKVFLKHWQTEEDMFGEEAGFNVNDFIYVDDDDAIYESLKKRGINIRQAGLKSKLESIYKSGVFKRKEPPKEVKSLNKLLKNLDTSILKSLVKSESKKGGFFHDKPYYGLPVYNEIVIEPGIYNPTIERNPNQKEVIPSVRVKNEEASSVSVDFDNFFD